MRVAQWIAGFCVLFFAGAALYSVTQVDQTPLGPANAGGTGTWMALATGFAGVAGVSGLLFAILHGLRNQPE